MAFLTLAIKRRLPGMGRRINGFCRSNKISPRPRIGGSAARLAWCVLTLSLLLAPSGPAQEAAAPSEYQVKAAFLFNFAKFVRWPDAAFPADDTPITIGILGDNPFGANLELAVRNKSVNGHPLVIRQVSLADLKQCHVLFIARASKSNNAEVLAALHNASVLTVSETEGFTEAGGMIRFLMESNKVRFEINDAAAKSAGLSISSKLLNLARKQEGGK